MSNLTPPGEHTWSPFHQSGEVCSGTFPVKLSLEGAAQRKFTTRQFNSSAIKLTGSNRREQREHADSARKGPKPGARTRTQQRDTSPLHRQRDRTSKMYRVTCFSVLSNTLKKKTVWEWSYLKSLCGLINLIWFN